MVPSVCAACVMQLLPWICWVFDAFPDSFASMISHTMPISLISPPFLFDDTRRCESSHDLGTCFSCVKGASRCWRCHNPASNFPHLQNVVFFILFLPRQLHLTYVSPFAFLSEICASVRVSEGCRYCNSLSRVCVLSIHLSRFPLAGYIRVCFSSMETDLVL